MKIKIAACSLVVVATLMFCYKAFSESFAQASVGVFNNLRLEIEPLESDYILGEPITLRLRILNDSQAEVKLYKGSNVQEGYLRLYVARDNDEYREYQGPDWGMKDVSYKEPFSLLKPGNVVETEATILWNHKAETSHLNPAAAARATHGLIDSNYAMLVPGVYKIKAILRQPKSAKAVESEPIQVHIRPPSGRDLQVWNKLKDNPNWAYFIQTGSTRGANTREEKSRMIDTLEQLLAQHPDSRYSAHISRGIEKYRELQNRLDANSNRNN